MSSENTELAQYHPDPENDKSWREIVDAIASQLEKDEVPENVIELTEYLLSGYSIHDAAKEIGKSPALIRRWLSQYPVIAAVLADNRKMLHKWRMAQLEKQFLKAIKVSNDILDLKFDDENANPKMVGVIAQQARYIMGMFAGQKVDINVTHELGDETLKATNDALKYLASELAGQRERADTEPIETTYRIVDERFQIGPVLDEDGNPKFGEIGVLDTNAEGTLCHICGTRIKSLSAHITRVHNIGVRDYELMFMLPEGALKNSGTEEDPDNG